MNERLLIDGTEFNITPQLIKESLEKNNGRLVVQGVIQRANTKNGNGRIYPKDTLSREVQKYKDTFIKENRALGELDHAQSEVINLKNVSHNIKDIWWDGDDVIARIEVLTTPSGNILKELFLNGITIGISSRGLGSVKQIGEAVEVQDDFELLCWDFVSTPSTQGAFMKIINESQEHSYNDKLAYIDELITEIICNRTGYCSCEFNSK